MPIVEITIQNQEEIDSADAICENEQMPIVEVTTRNATKADHIYVVEMSDNEFDRFKFTVESDLSYAMGVGFDCIVSPKSSTKRLAFDLKSFRAYQELADWPA